MRSYDSTVARMAGNILSGQNLVMVGFNIEACATIAVAAARAIIAEVQRTEPPLVPFDREVAAQ